MVGRVHRRTIQALFGYELTIMDRCRWHGWDYISIAPLALKKWATGSGKASKADMIKSVYDRTGLEIESPDEADAILVGLWGIETLKKY